MTKNLINSAKDLKMHMMMILQEEARRRTRALMNKLVLQGNNLNKQ